jgi:hypothetical protein
MGHRVTESQRNTINAERAEGAEFGSNGTRHRAAAGQAEKRNPRAVAQIQHRSRIPFHRLSARPASQAARVPSPLCLCASVANPSF